MSAGRGDRIEDRSAAGRKIYAFVGGFHTPQPLWKRVVSGFCQSDFENSLLIIWSGKNSTRDDLKILNEYIETFGNGAGKNIVVIPSTEEKIFSPYILRQATHFITSRKMISLECMDWLWDTDVKIVSALDDGIFDGEPFDGKLCCIDWREFFE